MVVEYNDSYETAWDRFVLRESLNGTFLQTRSFLNYHPKERFRDNSLLFMKGNNIVAVMPANIVEDNGEKILYSHMGSTFGGIVLGTQYRKIADTEEMFVELQNYLEEQHVNKIILKMTSDLYSKEKSDLLEYFLFANGYEVATEIGYYVDFDNYNANTIESNFNASRRRGWKKAMKNDMQFKELFSKAEIKQFYTILCNNMEKFHTKPIHSFEELCRLKESCVPENIRFFGVFYDGEIVAGSMVFCFDKKVFHTQYLATNQEKLALYPSEFLYYNLIKTAAEDKYDNLSFGTSTLEHGRILNKSLAQFKEGFGTREYVNRTFTKVISNDSEDKK